MPTYKKDPDAVLDFGCNWAAWLAKADDDTIASSTWTTPPGITEDSNTHDDTTTTIWLSGGTIGATYALTNRITTAGGRTDDRTIAVRIESR